MSEKKRLRSNQNILVDVNNMEKMYSTAEIGRESAFKNKKESMKGSKMKNMTSSADNRKNNVFNRSVVL